MSIESRNANSIETLAAETLQRVMEHPATQNDIVTVETQLGRYPRGMVAVGARCAVDGTPLVVITGPVLPGGIPFPTTMYLTSPEAVKAASHLEADGLMRQYNEMLADDAGLRAQYERAHAAYLTFRHGLAERLNEARSTSKV